MRVLVWVLVALVLGAAVWWLTQDESTSVDDVSIDDTNPTTERAGLEGMTEVAEGAGSDTLVDLPPGAMTLDGTVEDPSGAPLDGIRIELHHGRGTESERPSGWLEPNRIGVPETTWRLCATTRSDARGRFAFRGLPAGSYHVRAIGRDGWFSGSEWVWLSSHPAESTVRLVIGEGHLVRVRVVDGAGEGLRADLEGFRERDREGWFPWSLIPLETDSNGRASILAPAATLRLTIHVPGVGTRRGVTVGVPQDDELVLRFDSENSVTLRGRVVDTSGNPVAGARLVITSRRGAYDGEYQSRFVMTAADGSYAVTGLIDGMLEQVGAAAKGYLTLDNAAQPRALTAGSTEIIDVTLVRGGSVVGTVTGPTGEALAGARVEAHASNARSGFSSWDRGVSDAQGRFTLDAVPLGAGTLRVSVVGYYQSREDGASVGERYEITDEGQAATVDVVMARGTPLTGRVVDSSGVPVENAEVRLTGRNKEGWWRFDDGDRFRVTGRDGTFRHEGVPPSPAWTLEAFTPGRHSEGVQVAVASGEPPPDPIELVLRPGAIVAGQLLVGGEAPTTRLRVTCKQKGGNHLQTVPVGADGTFRIAGLGPADVEVYAVDRNFTKVSTVFETTLDWGTVRDDVVLDAKVLGSIAGVVVDPGGNPVGGLQLRLNIETPHSSRSASASTTPTGRFEFGSLEDTGFAYTISIGNDVQPGTYEPGDTDVRIVFRRPETIVLKGTVRLPDGRPVVSGYVQITETVPNTSTISRGAPIIDGGFAMRVAPRSDDSTFSASVSKVADNLGRPVNIRPMTIASVTPGVSIDFQLTEGLVLEGRVVDDQGKGLSGAQVAIEYTTTGAHISPVPTRDDGTFRFESLRPGKLSLEVRVGLPWVRPPKLFVDAGDRDVHVVLERGTTIEGRVVGPDGKGVPDVTATFYWTADGASRSSNVSARTNANGAFLLQGAPPNTTGAISVTAPRENPDGILGARVESVVTGTSDVLVTLTTGVTIEGEVTGPEGEAVRFFLMCRAADAGHAHQYYGARVEEGKTGFVLGPMPPGRYTITAHIQAEGLLSPDPIEVTAPSTGVVVRAQRGHVVRGTIGGEFERNRMVVQFVLLTANGPYAYGGGITHAGEFAITMKDETPGTLFIQERDGTRYALVERVRPADGPFEVTLREGLEVSGRIHEYDTARGGGYVYLQGETGITINAKVEKDGSFRAVGAPPGVYDVLGFTQEGQLESEHGVKAGADNVVLKKAAK